MGCSMRFVGLTERGIPRGGRGRGVVKGEGPRGQVLNSAFWESVIGFDIEANGASSYKLGLNISNTFS